MLLENFLCFQILNKPFGCTIWTRGLPMLVVSWPLTKAVVVVQLAERLLPIPEDPGSNPVIGNFY